MDDKPRHTRRAEAATAVVGSAANVPEYATIDGWCRLTGMGRTATYYALAAGHLTAIKLGKRTLIRVRPGLAWIEAHPEAEIRVAYRATAAA